MKTSNNSINKFKLFKIITVVLLIFCLSPMFFACSANEKNQDKGRSPRGTNINIICDKHGNSDLTLVNEILAVNTFNGQNDLDELYKQEVPVNREIDLFSCKSFRYEYKFTISNYHWLYLKLSLATDNFKIEIINPNGDVKEYRESQKYKLSELDNTRGYTLRYYFSVNCDVNFGDYAPPVYAQKDFFVVTYTIKTI